MRTAYVVMGTCGEYSDRTEWPVCWYSSEQDAQSHVLLASAEAKRILGEAKTWLKVHEHGPNPYDPDMQTDYTGTEYYVMSVPRGRLPKPSA